MPTQNAIPLSKRPLDLLLVVSFCVFAFTSLVYEQYIVFGIDLAKTTDPIGRSWYWYAHSFDPVFLKTPLWLRIMCGIDAFVFGPCYLYLIYAFIKCDDRARLPALLYGSAIVYSTLVYFGWEFLNPANRAHANLWMVVVVNIPYTIIPLLLMWRMWPEQPFSKTTQ